MRSSKFIFLFFIFLSACGVKGKPLPPLVPPPIGRGEPGYSGSVPVKKATPVPYRPPQIEEEEDDSPSVGE